MIDFTSANRGRESSTHSTCPLNIIVDMRGMEKDGSSTTIAVVGSAMAVSKKNIYTVIINISLAGTVLI